MTKRSRGSFHAIYCILNIITEKSYVGSAVDINERWKSHRTELKRGSHHSRKLQHSWNKHGASAFIFVEIERVADKYDLLNREQFWIDRLNSVKGGYNQTPTAGSCIGNIHPEETRRKISAAHQGRKLTAEHRAKIAEGVRNSGKRVVSEEGRRKLSAARIGRPNPKLKGREIKEEWRKKIRATMTGRTLSSDHTKNIKEALKAKAARGECDYVFRAAAARKALPKEVRSEIIKRAWATRRARAAQPSASELA